MKANNSRKVGDIHSNGKWMWMEYQPGKFDWRAIKKAEEETEEMIISLLDDRIKSANMNAKMSYVGDLCGKLQSKFGYSQKSADRLVKNIEKKYDKLFQESFNNKFNK